MPGTLEQMQGDSSGSCLIFSAARTVKRQSLQLTVLQVDLTGLDSSVTTTQTLTDVAAGSYSVSVMAVNGNEYGTSQDMTASFVSKVFMIEPGNKFVDCAVCIYVYVVRGMCICVCVWY